MNDIHSYPYPGDPQPSATQYAMVGEFGGIGAFVVGKEWKPKSCHTYLHVDTPADEADAYVKMAATIASRVDHISSSVYTQVLSHHTTPAPPQPHPSPTSPHLH